MNHSIRRIGKTMILRRIPAVSSLIASKNSRNPTRETSMEILHSNGKFRYIALYIYVSSALLPRFHRFNGNINMRHLYALQSVIIVTHTYFLISSKIKVKLEIRVRDVDKVQLNNEKNPEGTRDNGYHSINYKAD